MKTTVSLYDLENAALDYAVAQCELMLGQDYTLAIDTDIDGTKRVNFGGMYPEWSADWQEAGPIIEREGISLKRVTDALWEATIMGEWTEDGPTPLIAAMRCYVGSRLGNEIQLPEGLKP